MTLLYIFLAALAILLIINIVLTLKAGKNESGIELAEIKSSIGALSSNLKDTERNLKDEFVTNRKEGAETAIGLRTELGNNLNQFTQTFSEQLGNLTQTNEEKLEAIRKTFEEKLLSFQKGIDDNSKESRRELKENLDAFKLELNAALQDYKERLREQFSAFETNQKTHHSAHNEQLSGLKLSLEKSVQSMQESNEQKLEEMRKTVDEKLNETLEKRLGESFKQVSDRLEAVHKGLGEMQTLAVSVGDLRKVMSNVKSRGVLGEYQLQNIIEDLLTNEQYEKNVKTKVGSGAVVEFAIKMPNGNNLEKTLWLPIDSKFPKEDYEALVDAYEQADAEKIDRYQKAFIAGIKKNAKDIKEKYIDPPNTTEYGIMFLPFESLFGEVLRVPGLFDQIQKDYKITITGPTTLSALLNSLQMGFRTLAIEKRSSEVWDLLGAVKTEFGQFGDVLAKTKKKLIEATNVIDTSEVRTRAIERKLRHVQELPAAETKLILEAGQDDDATDEII
ncbi:MAG: DNA recombination protein RmuC [Bacteroidetes bacterium]|nr:DNA recombination protein RmuC [Bacteroidota bacterium]